MTGWILFVRIHQSYPLLFYGQWGADDGGCVVCLQERERGEGINIKKEEEDERENEEEMGFMCTAKFYSILSTSLFPYLFLWQCKTHGFSLHCICSLPKAVLGAINSKDLDRQ